MGKGDLKMAFKKYIEIERLGHEDTQELLNHSEDTIVIEEKVDGGNGCFWQEDDGVHFGSRNRDLTLEGDKKAFQMYQELLRKHLTDLETQGIKLNPDYYYYIEWMQKHTINYTNIPPYIGFDIRLKRSIEGIGAGLFLGREGREQEFNRLKIENIPLIWKGKVSELKKLSLMELIPKSKYYGGFAEGIVIKNYCRKHLRENHQLYAKLVREEFKEDNKAVFGSVRSKVTDTQKIIKQYVTDARIKKMILKFINEENKPLTKELMKELPRRVIKDMLEEEISTISQDYSFLDFKEIRGVVPKMCYRVLCEVMNERAGIGGG
jgi:hypothetical protein